MPKMKSKRSAGILSSADSAKVRKQLLPYG